ncbi:MAG: hypothetical protein ABIJ56_18750 [Pseudomonadota bacterium]
MAKRTTVTLDNQVMEAVKARAVKEGKTFGQALNEILRKWLSTAGSRKEGKIKLEPCSMGKPRVDISDREDLFDAMEKE